MADRKQLDAALEAAHSVLVYGPELPVRRILDHLASDPPIDLRRVDANTSVAALRSGVAPDRSGPVVVLVGSHVPGPVRVFLAELADPNRRPDCKLVCLSPTDRPDPSLVDLFETPLSASFVFGDLL